MTDRYLIVAFFSLFHFMTNKAQHTQHSLIRVSIIKQQIH